MVFYNIFSILMQQMCLFVLLLGMAGTIMLWLLGLPYDTSGVLRLMLILILLCLWSLLIQKRGRLRLFGVLAGALLMVCFLWGSCDYLDGGFKIIGNHIIDLINKYYHTDFIKWYQVETAKEAQAAFQLFFIILGALTGILFYKAPKGKWAFLLKSIIPVLIVVSCLLVGRKPSEYGILFMMYGVILGQLFQSRSGVLPAAGCIVISAAAYLFAFGPGRKCF